MPDDCCMTSERFASTCRCDLEFGPRPSVQETGPETLLAAASRGRAGSTSLGVSKPGVGSGHRRDRRFGALGLLVFGS